MKSALVLIGALAAAGCSKHATEMILVITTEGVRIPEDVHRVHLTVQDRSPAGDDTVYEQDVELCSADGAPSGCYDIPVSAVLFPGKSRGNDSVRVQVDAVGASAQVVIADAALFTFAEEQSLRLDFVLYGNCLGNVACAARDQACGPLDTCVALGPTRLEGPPDLARPSPIDQSLPADMTAVDLAGTDLYTPPSDLVSTLDMAGCGNVACPNGQVCQAGTCVPCGALDELCCQTPTTSGTCAATNTTCDGTFCVLCGQPGQLCCVGRIPDCFFSGSMCAGGRCSVPMSTDLSMSPYDLSLPAGGADLF